MDRYDGAQKRGDKKVDCGSRGNGVLFDHGNDKTMGSLDMAGVAEHNTANVLAEFALHN